MAVMVLWRAAAMPCACVGIAIAGFAAAGVLDLLDGYVARRFNQQVHARECVGACVLLSLHQHVLSAGRLRRVLLCVAESRVCIGHTARLST
jgi:hypothetical protein